MHSHGAKYLIPVLAAILLSWILFTILCEHLLFDQYTILQHVKTVKFRTVSDMTVIFKKTYGRKTTGARNRRQPVKGDPKNSKNPKVDPKKQEDNIDDSMAAQTPVTNITSIVKAKRLTQ